jgi:Fur family zinc uptake transcriptional regulator
VRLNRFLNQVVLGLPSWPLCPIGSIVVKMCFQSLVDGFCFPRKTRMNLFIQKGAMKTSNDGPKKNAYKQTAQRTAILKVLRRSTKSLTALEVLERVRKTHPKVSQDTIYRNLLLLVELGDVSQTHLQNKVASRFEFQSGGTHHHHAICLGCGRSFCLAGNPEPVFQGVKEDKAFRVTGHILEFHGLCGVCSRRPMGGKSRK